MFSFFTRRSSVLVILMSVLMMGYGASAYAVSVSPVIYDQSADPGQVLQGTIRVQNDTAQEQTYYTSAQNFVSQGEEGQQTFLPEAEKDGLASWISLEENTVKLQAGKSHDFKWALNVPKNAEPGGHYAAVFFSTAPNTSEQSSVGVGGKTGVLFLVNVSGNVKEAADIESFNVMTTKDPIAATSFLNREEHGQRSYQASWCGDGEKHAR
jgi:hypothetical protein